MRSYYRERSTIPNQLTLPRPTSKPIEIGTEEFLVAQGPPRPVRITTNHVNDDARKEFHKPFYKDAFRFAEPSSATHGQYSPFSITAEVPNPESSPVRDWVLDRLVP